LFLAACTRSTPLIHVDHDVPLSAIPSTPRTGRRCDHSIVGFAAPPVVCQHIGSPAPDYVYPVALQTDYVPLRHMLPELERLINAFYSSLPSPFTRRPRIAYGSSNVHDTNDPTSACGIDGPYKFLVFPLPTPTRTSLVSFEPLLPLLTSRCSLLFILLFDRLDCCPAFALASSRERSHSGTQSVVLSDLLSRWSGAQLVDSADDLYCGRFPEKRFRVVLPEWSRIGFPPGSRRRLSRWG